MHSDRRKTWVAGLLPELVGDAGKGRHQADKERGEERYAEAQESFAALVGNFETGQDDPLESDGAQRCGNRRRRATPS